VQLHDGGRNLEAAVTALQQDVLESGSPVDSAGAVVARPAAADMYSVRSERLLMEEMDYNVLFRWFVGLNLDDPEWDATVFTGHTRLFHFPRDAA
jgi:hypothetical protein